MRTRTKVFLLGIASTILTLLAAPGCGSDSEPAPFDLDGKSRPQGEGEGICLLNNCTDDIDCSDCSGEKTVCNQQEKRCVACGPGANGKQCSQGKTCTKYGDCVPIGLTCPEDQNGVPTKSCKNNADCAACGPNNKVCDQGKCVGCTTENTTNCQSTDTCKDNKCVPKCPSTCDEDGDCSECGADGTAPAGACNRHMCAECSPTKPCANGDRCDFEHGKCIKKCGINNRGTEPKCLNDNDCAGCTGTTKCQIPVNGGEGKCVVPVPGCSDLSSSGIFVLPDPFSRVTNLCSNDNDCANVSMDVNVGKMLRDFTGLDLINDASFSYGMHACADVEVLGASCGVCVPCKVDTDCEDIDPLKLAGDAFGPLGSIGARILLDKVFGPGEKKVHTYCQQVAGDYGVCLPCANPLQGCKVTGNPVPEGNCNHGVCQKGDALSASCADTCAIEVCKKDPYCCSVEWDQLCMDGVDLYCENRTCYENSCHYHDPGWYCDPEGSGYRCDGVMVTTVEGRQCPTGQFCNRAEPGNKANAVLCQSEAEPGCGPGMVGRPRCFASKNY